MIVKPMMHDTNNRMDPCCHIDPSARGASYTKGLFFNYLWYSVCSKHRPVDINCTACHCGTWVAINSPMRIVESIIYQRAYWLWYWWVNFPKVGILPNPCISRIE